MLEKTRDDDTLLRVNLLKWCLDNVEELTDNDPTNKVLAAYEPVAWPMLMAAERKEVKLRKMYTELLNDCCRTSETLREEKAAIEEAKLEVDRDLADVLHFREKLKQCRVDGCRGRFSGQYRKTYIVPLGRSAYSMLCDACGAVHYCEPGQGTTRRFIRVE